MSIASVHETPGRLGAVCHTTALGDGRTVGVAAYGDPLGAPWLYLHGAPGSRFSPCWQLRDPRGGVAGVRLFALDRPGWGRSSPPARNRPWSADVREVAAALHLSRFGVVGVGAGGRAALELAAELPDLVEQVVVVGAALPTRAGEQADADPRIRRVHRVSARAPFLLPLMAAGRRRAALRLAAAVEAEDVLAHRSWFGQEATSPRWWDERFRAAYAADLAEAFRRGDGLVADWRALSAPWRTDFSAITAPVQVWHPLDDSVVPYAAAERAVALLRHGSLVPMPGDHASAWLHWPHALSAAVQSAG